MPIAFTQAAAVEDFSATSTTIALAYAGNVTLHGDCIIVAYSNASATTHNTCTDNNGGSYAKVKDTVQGAGRVSWWEARDHAAGATTVTVTFSANVVGLIHVLEYSGMRLASQAFNNGSGKDASGTGTTITGGAVTPSEDGCINLAWIVDVSTSQVVTAAGGYTKRATATSTLAQATIVDLIQTTRGSTAAAATIPLSSSWLVSSCVFLPPAASTRLPGRAASGADLAGGMSSSQSAGLGAGITCERRGRLWVPSGRLISIPPIIGLRRAA